MSKHTPGPWFYEDYHVWAGDDKEDGAITSGGCGCCNDWDEGVVRKEDARFIASAPDMLEALENIANHYDMDGYGDKAWKELALEMAEIARAAIAKATGK